MGEGVSASRFYMLRAVVAMAHADGVVTAHELSFINEHIKHINLSKSQIEMIGVDLKNPQDVYQMFSHITNAEDRRDFFALARALSWCDGDYDAQEKHIITQLEKHVISEENLALLQKSRDIINEVELCENQWKFKTTRSKNLFGFLKVLKTA